MKICNFKIQVEKNLREGQGRCQSWDVDAARLLSVFLFGDLLHLVVDFLDGFK